MDTTEQIPQDTVPERSPKWPRRLTYAAGLAVALGAGIGIGAVGHTKTVTKTVTNTVVSASPSPVTVTVSPPPPPPESTIFTTTGSGNQATKTFTAGGDGDYIVYWTFSNNDAGGTGGDNFIVNEDNGNDANVEGLPNVVQASGSGSTEATDDAGTHFFDVQADQTATWTITVKTAQ
jgi:hypothetical protein